MGSSQAQVAGNDLTNFWGSTLGLKRYGTGALDVLSLGQTAAQRDAKNAQQDMQTKADQQQKDLQRKVDINKAQDAATMERDQLRARQRATVLSMGGRNATILTQGSALGTPGTGTTIGGGGKTLLGS